MPIALLPCTVVARRLKLSTLRIAASCVLLFATPRLGASQPLELTLSSIETHADNTARLKVLLKAPSESAPAGLQWIFRLPPGLTIAGIEASEALKTAGKSIVCKEAKCIVYGLNRKTIPNGSIALLTIRSDRSQQYASFQYHAGIRQGTKAPTIGIGDVVAVSPDGNEIAVIQSADHVVASQRP